MAERRNPLDIDGGNFDVEAHLSGLLKAKTLPELLDTEHQIVGEVRQLDSEMQTLVYENYSKFITATDTIRKMKADFVRMEDEMDALAGAMNNITASAEKVSSGLSGQRAAVSRLAAASNTLQRLEFLFQLPKNLQAAVERKDLDGAVRAYLKSRPILEKYKELPAFASIYTECEGLVGELREGLKEEFRSSSATNAELKVACGQLVSLGEPQESLAADYLRSAERRLREQLERLEDENRLKAGEKPICSPQPSPESSPEHASRVADGVPSLPMDVLEFVDSGCSGLLSDLSLVVAAYLELFAEPGAPPPQALSDLSGPLLTDLLALTGRRFAFERTPSDSGLVVRALDRFYRRFQANMKVIGGSASCEALIMSVAEAQIALSRAALNADFAAQLKEIRQTVAAGPARPLLSPGDGPASPPTPPPFSERGTRLENVVTAGLKTALANLLQFTAAEVTFAGQGAFLRRFAPAVRETLVVGFFRGVVATAADFCDGKADKAHVNSSLILLLSRFAKNLEASTAGYILDLCEQQLRLGTLGSAADALTPTATVLAELASAGRSLLSHYVWMEGQSLSQLLVKSVEARDWVACVEPRGVRAVMKRVVEDLTATEGKVSSVYPSGPRKEASDSSRHSRRTGLSGGGSRAKLPSLGGPQLGESALRDRLGKLWSERIDYFGDVEFNRGSIMEGIVKISLKTLLESIRLQSFNKYGVQQVQVDAHYLELYVWRFVADEALLHGLLDELVSSALHRATEPTLMDPAIVNMICERG